MCDINIADPQGRTVLHSASDKLDTGLVRSLVDAKDLASLLTVEEGQLLIEACGDISYGTSFIRSV